MQNQEKVKSAIDLILKKKTERYPIYLAENLLLEVPKILEELGLLQESKVLVLTNQKLSSFYGEKLQASFTNLTKVKSSFELFWEEIPEGEHAKSWSNAQSILCKLIEYKFDRQSLIIALGGGVTGDLAGFVSSVYQRGINFVQIPTSLLAMVDASVGGKVAVNLGSQGKNLIGSFFQPKAVLIDLVTLETLPRIEWKNGLSEILKSSLLSDDRGDFFTWLEKKQASLFSYQRANSQEIKEMIYRSIQIKAKVVCADEKEKNGQRALLNLGHTFAHALESLSNYQIPHGQAVALGLILALEFSYALNKISSESKKRIKKLLQALLSDVSVKEISDKYALRTEKIIESFYLDKKTERQQLKFVLPVEPLSKSELVCNPDQSKLYQVIDSFLQGSLIA